MATPNSWECGFPTNNNAGQAEDQGATGGRQWAWKQGLWKQAATRAVTAGG